MPLSREFVERIPKTDLHVHLDGSLRIGTLLELARSQGIALPGSSEAELRRTLFKKDYGSLEEYLKPFGFTTRVLQDEASLSRVAYELAVDNQNEGVRYIEVRLAPQLHQNRRLDVTAVLRAVDAGLRRAAEEFNGRAPVVEGGEPPFSYGIIVCAMRMFDYGFSEYFDQLLDVHRHSDRRWIFSLASQELVKASVEARDNSGLPVVGFDLAGREEGYPAVQHVAAYTLAHKSFLKKTVHAGEAFGPESIFQAITDLYADRIGHGVHLFDSHLITAEDIPDKEAYVRSLAQYICDRRITIEVCLTSNLQTNPHLRRLEEHSFARMREAKMSVTFCTDNRTVSQTTVTDEIMKAAAAFAITPHELKNFIIYGFKRNFFPGPYVQKRQYIRRVLQHYESLESQFLGQRS